MSIHECNPYLKSNCLELAINQLTRGKNNGINDITDIRRGFETHLSQEVVVEVQGTLRTKEEVLPSTIGHSSFCTWC